MPRFRFADFVVSPARRQLLRGGREVPLIPRYFDLLVLLLERRGQAVHRRDILERVWNDVVVSDGALSQAVRTLRRALEDDSQEPTFIRTVSRHGYRFDYPDVVEEPEAGPEVVLPAPETVAVAAPAVAAVPTRAARWGGAVAGAAAAGLLAGAVGGMALVFGPGADAPASVPAVLALVGAVVGALGAAGVGAGLVAAEEVRPARRAFARVAFGALGGGLVGLLTHFLARWTFRILFGHDIAAVGGAVEGLVLGAAAGLAHATAPPADGGGRARLRAALWTAAACGLAGLAASAAGAYLAGTSLQTLARTFHGSQVQLAPVARLLGEAELGPLTRNVLGLYEGALFGFGLTLGFMRRPR